jgi:hypothetical protein
VKSNIRKKRSEFKNHKNLLGLYRLHHFFVDGDVKNRKTFLLKSTVRKDRHSEQYNIHFLDNAASIFFSVEIWSCLGSQDLGITDWQST